MNALKKNNLFSNPFNADTPSTHTFMCAWTGRTQKEPILGGFGVLVLGLRDSNSDWELEILKKCRNVNFSQMMLQRG